MNFWVRKWTKVCEKSQKRGGEILEIQDEVVEGGTEISEVFIGRFCQDAACGGKADGWGVRVCAAALTVGLIFWLLFEHSEK